MHSQMSTRFLLLTAVPVPTYFTIGRERLPTAVQESIAGGSPEIAPNLIFIGKLLSFEVSLHNREDKCSYDSCWAQDCRCGWRL